MNWRDYQDLLALFKEQILKNPEDNFWRQQLVDLVKNQQEYDSKEREQKHTERLKQIEVDAELNKKVIQKDILYDRNTVILRLADRLNIDPAILIDQLRLVGDD